MRVIGSMLTGLALAVSAVAQSSQGATNAAPLPSSIAVATTRVHGTITDPDGALIPGATVTLTPDKGRPLTAKSGADGTYAVSALPGKYGVVVTMPGFATYSAVNVTIPAATSTTLDASLQIGVQTQVVTVDANTVQLSVDPDTNASSTVLTGKDLDALSDDPDELSSELTALAGPSAGPNGGQIYVDGFTGGQLPPKSSIREIRINQNPFSAQFDRLGYGRIEVFTKPGTDTIHGNIQVNGNPSEFNSSNPLETGYQPPYHTIFSFGNLTGPLSKMASYNIGGSYRQIQDDEFTNATILAMPGSTTLCPPGAASAACVSTPFELQTYYPQTRGDINPRLDLALGEKNVLTMRYQFVKNIATNSGVGNLNLPSVGQNTSSTSNIVQISDTQTFSPSLINETRFEYEREHVADTPLSNDPNITVEGSFGSGGSFDQRLSDHQDHFEVQNYTSLQTKKNFIRTGGRLRTTREAQDTEDNTNGAFTYSSLTYTCTGTVAGTSTPCTTPTTGIGTAADNSYQTGTPSQFQITQVNNHKIGDTYADLELYAETDWKARQNLTVSYGIRYETQNHLPDHHDFAPRVSVNYGLGNGKGTPKTVLRGGFGIFYDRFAQEEILTLEQENGTNEQVYTVPNPGADCVPGAANLIAACVVSAGTQTVYSAAPSLRSPYTIQSAVGADQQLWKVGTLSVNYIHSQGVHQIAAQNINYPATIMSGPNYQYFSGGVFNQNQLTLNGRVQTSKRISLFGFYALGSAHGDTSGTGGFVTEPFHIAEDYGRTTYDARSKYFIAGSVTLPKYILFSPFVIGQTGNPYNVTSGFDSNNDTIFNDRPAFAAPNGIAAGTKGTNTIAGCGSFGQTGAPGSTSGVIPINYCTGPSLFTFNFRLTKTIGFGKVIATNHASGGGQGGGHGAPGGGGGGRGGPFGFGGGGGASTGKRYNLAFGMQVQNLFNNEDLATPQAQLTSPDFGRSTQVTGGPYTTNSALRRITLQTSFNF